MVRAEDTVARIGGDEFVVLIEEPEPETDLALLSERIRSEVCAPIELSRGTSLRIGVSVGVAVSAEPLADPLVLLEAADNAMYRVKHPAGELLETR